MKAPCADASCMPWNLPDILRRWKVTPLNDGAGCPKSLLRATPQILDLEVQQRYFAYRATCSDSIAKLFGVCVCGGGGGYRTTIARYAAKWGISYSCACVKLNSNGGVIAPIWGVASPKGPNLEKFQDLETFKRAWNFQASHPANPYFLWGILEVRIDNFKRDWNFQARLKISSDLEFFQDLGP